MLLVLTRATGRYPQRGSRGEGKQRRHDSDGKPRCCDGLYGNSRACIEARCIRGATVCERSKAAKVERSLPSKLIDQIG